MDRPENKLQDLVRCHLCDASDPALHCDVCKLHLCKDCEGKHLSDESKEHKLVQFRYREIFLKCQTHTSEVCKLYCEECDTPICAVCVSLKEHHTHYVIDALNCLVSKKHALEIDLQELEKYIHPKYQEIVTDISDQKIDLIEKFRKLTAAIIKHGENLHREVDLITKKLKADMDEIEKQSLVVLNEQDDEITQTISEIEQCIFDIKKLLKSNDARFVSTYKSRNAKFRKMPPKINFTVPKCIPPIININQIRQHFVWLNSLSMAHEERIYARDSPGAESSLITRDEPWIVSDINTEYELRSVSCLNDESVWTCSNDNVMRLYNLHGELVKSVQSKSGNIPYDIAVTKNGDLVYTDIKDKTVNIIKNKHIHTMVRKREWRPLGVCSTSDGDLLVVMNSNGELTKVVRYSGHTKKQSFKYNKEGQPLYSPGGYNKYICENRNLDICVSDFEAHAVVVVNQFGKHKFIYTGTPPITWAKFTPVGITSDIHSRILIADINNNCIHILDEDGHFLRFIDNCHLYAPFGLCVDTKGNVFVSEYYRGKVKEIQYHIDM